MVRSLSDGALIYSRLCRAELPAGAAAPCPLSQLKVRFRLFGSEATSVSSFFLPEKVRTREKRRRDSLRILQMPQSLQFLRIAILHICQVKQNGLGWTLLSGLPTGSSYKI